MCGQSKIATKRHRSRVVGSDFAARIRANALPSVEESGVGASTLRVHSTVHARCRAKWFSCSHSQSQLSWDSEEGHGGRYQLWPKRSLAIVFHHLWPTPSLAKRMTNCGQTKFGQHHVLVFEVGWGAGSGGRWSGRGPEGEGLRRERAPNLEKVEGPEGLRPRRVGPEGWEAQNFAFFSFSCHNFLSFFPLLGSSRGIFVVFCAGALKSA